MTYNIFEMLKSLGVSCFLGNIAGNLLNNQFKVVGFDILPDRMAALDELGL